jgi:hypothetical protein
LSEDVFEALTDEAEVNNRQKYYKGIFQKPNTCEKFSSLDCFSFLLSGEMLYHVSID